MPKFEKSVPAVAHPVQPPAFISHPQFPASPPATLLPRVQKTAHFAPPHRGNIPPQYFKRLFLTCCFFRCLCTSEKNPPPVISTGTPLAIHSIDHKTGRATLDRTQSEDRTRTTWPTSAVQTRRHPSSCNRRSAQSNDGRHGTARNRHAPQRPWRAKFCLRHHRSQGHPDAHHRPGERSRVVPRHPAARVRKNLVSQVIKLLSLPPQADCSQDSVSLVLKKTPPRRINKVSRRTQHPDRTPGPQPCSLSLPRLIVRKASQPGSFFCPTACPPSPPASDAALTARITWDVPRHRVRAVPRRTLFADPRVGGPAEVVSDGQTGWQKLIHPCSELPRRFPLGVCPLLRILATRESLMYLFD